MGESSVNNFREDLVFSQAASDEAFWNAIYIKAFPNLVNQMLTSGDTKAQRMGIDRVLHLSNGRTIYIDEKKRRREYNDILLEYVSVDRTGKPGWIEKDLSIDYLAYAFMQSQRVYLYPWLLLRRAWLQYGSGWISQYGTVTAKNRTYNTLSVPVPTSILKKAVSTASVIQL